MLITVSGVEGSGKDELVSLVEVELTKRGKTVLQMDFPESKNWLLLDKLKADGKYYDLYSKEQSYINYLMNFERLSFLMDYVIPNLEHYDYVILKRYFIDFEVILDIQMTDEKNILLLKDMNRLIKCKSANYCIDVSHELAYERLCKNDIYMKSKEEKVVHSILTKSYKRCMHRNYFSNKILNGKKNIEELAEKVIMEIFEYDNLDENKEVLD